MPAPSGKTNLIFTERKLIGGQVKLVVHSQKIEIYTIEDGLETFRGYLNLLANPVFAEQAISRIWSEIKERPISARSRDWLNALHHQGLLDVYGERA